MAKKRRIRQLLKAYISGIINRKEFDELHDYVAGNLDDDEIAMFMNEILLTLEPDNKLDVNSEKIYEKIINNQRFSVGRSQDLLPQRSLSFFSRWSVRGIAAIICLGTVLFLYHSYQPTTNQLKDRGAIRSLKRNSISGEPKRAILKLADGTVIDLDCASKGILATQGDTKVVLKEGGIAYTASDKADGTNIAKNTIITPKGRQYHIVLPDGTKVWLNAATTLTYPVCFTNKRLVEIAGEAYFEIAEDKNIPFIVKSSLQEIEVLGTSFNVRSYDDDSSSVTTLITVKVMVNHQAENGKSLSALLTPGQQAIVDTEDRVSTRVVDTDETISWKDGVFVFNNEEIKDVMKKVSRWYDIDVDIRDGMEGKRIGGSIQQFKDVKKIMQSLQATGLLHYYMEGGKIVIIK
ncbi:FecR family protein [bacterium A37T11]|nr:FecR family protein [bacterium A37T11]